MKNSNAIKDPNYLRRLFSAIVVVAVVLLFSLFVNTPNVSADVSKTTLDISNGYIITETTNSAIYLTSITVGETGDVHDGTAVTVVYNGKTISTNTNGNKASVSLPAGTHNVVVTTDKGKAYYGIITIPNSTNSGTVSRTMKSIIPAISIINNTPSDTNFYYGIQSTLSVTNYREVQNNSDYPLQYGMDFTIQWYNGSVKVNGDAVDGTKLTITPGNGDKFNARFVAIKTGNSKLDSGLSSPSNPQTPSWLKRQISFRNLNDIYLPNSTSTIATTISGCIGPVTFSSSDSSILEINSSTGVLIARKDGSAIITATVPQDSTNMHLSATVSEIIFVGTGSILKVNTVGNGAVKLNETGNLPAQYKNQLIMGTVISLTGIANEGSTFVYWEDVNSGSIISDKPVYGFSIGSGVNIKAVFNLIPTERTTEFTVVFKDKSGKILQNTKVAKNAAAIPPNTPALFGYGFIGWDKEFTNVVSDIIVTALYERVVATHTVTVVGGTFLSSGTTGAFQFDKPVTVVTGAAPLGKKFSYWEQDGKKISTKDTFTFFAPSKVTTISAIYLDNTPDIVEVPFITLSEDVMMDATTMMFTANRNIPKDYLLVESGVIMLESNTTNTNELTVYTANVILGKIKDNSTDQFYIRKANITAGDTCYARAYLIYKDLSGNITTVYSANTVSKVMGGQ